MLGSAIDRNGGQRSVDDTGVAVVASLADRVVVAEGVLEDSIYCHISPCERLNFPTKLRWTAVRVLQFLFSWSFLPVSP